LPVHCHCHPPYLHSFPTRRSSDLTVILQKRDSLVNCYTVSINGIMVRNNLSLLLDGEYCESHMYGLYMLHGTTHVDNHTLVDHRSEEHTSELQSRENLVCRLLLEK